MACNPHFWWIGRPSNAYTWIPRSFSRSRQLYLIDHAIRYQRSVGALANVVAGIMTAIAGARRSICIQTPYFLPTEGLNSLLQTAALGGIDVQLMLPERSDSRIIDKAVHSFIDDMLPSRGEGLLLYQRLPAAKMLIVDDLLTVVGSVNMDFRSFEHNFEINAFVYGQDFNTAMRRVFDEDLRSCWRLIPSNGCGDLFRSD